MNFEETPKDSLPEEPVAAEPAAAESPSATPVAPEAAAPEAAAPEPVIVETEPVVDADVAEGMPAAVADMAPVSDDASASESMTAAEAPAVEPEPVVDADVAEGMPAAVADVAPEGDDASAAESMTTAEAPVVESQPAEAAELPAGFITPAGGAVSSEDEEFVIPRARKKAAAKPKSDAPKTPRKPSRKKEKLPDLGDGSGYIAPDEVDVSSVEDAPWFAVHCYSGQENKVKTNLEQRIETMGMAGKILKIIVPTEDEIEVRDGKRKTVKRQVFPGYVLVQMHMSEESWFVVRNTPGVTRFVGMGNRPQPLSQQEVNVLLGRMEAEAPKIKVNFRTGQKVRITDGPFADFIGVVDKIDTERAKVVALVSFFGRETPVELDFLQVEKT
jgi:transcription termination/antitermination protein NusG